MYYGRLPCRTTAGWITLLPWLHVVWVASHLSSASVVVERSPGMREVGGSIPGRVKQKTLKFEVLLLCLALSTKELETVWPARSQNNGLGWDITAYPWGGVSVG